MAWKGDSRRHGLARKGIKTRIDKSKRFDVSKYVSEGVTHYKSPEAFVDAMLDERKSEFNNYKTPQDRKYFLYDLIRYKKKEYGVEVELLRGSNQVLVTLDGKRVYDSFQDNLTKKGFKNLLIKIIRKFPIKYNVASGNRKYVRYLIDRMVDGEVHTLRIPFNDSKNYKRMLKYYKKAKNKYPNEKLWFVGVDERHNLTNIHHFIPKR